MSLKEKLPLYITASASKHFKTAITTIRTFVEGIEERDFSGEESWIEIRIDGPNISEVSNGLLRVTSEINLLVCTHIDPDDPFAHVTNVGKVANIFEDFDIYKYSDDKSILGCYKLDPTTDVKDKIQISNMGQIDPNVKLLQTTIEGHYKMFVDKE